MDVIKAAIAQPFRKSLNRLMIYPLRLMISLIFYLIDRKFLIKKKKLIASQCCDGMHFRGLNRRIETGENSDSGSEQQ